jgi:hypothetical protein
MKASEILRGLADLIDKASATSTDQTTSQFTPIQEPTTAGQTPTMVPPLQAKLEILKKSVGLDNHYDSECGEPDEVDQLKKHAGINIVAQQEASEDNDIVG